MRKWLAVFVALALVSAPALAQTWVVKRDNGTSALLEDDGTLLCEWNLYSLMYCVSDAGCPPERQLFAAAPTDIAASELKTWEWFALLDAAGERLTDFVYGGFTHYSAAGAVVACRDGFYGALDERGREVLPFAYDAVIPDGADGFLVTLADSRAQSARLCHIDAGGALTDTGILTEPYLYGTLADDRLPLPDSKTDLRGYVNSRGDFHATNTRVWTAPRPCCRSATR